MSLKCTVVYAFHSANNIWYHFRGNNGSSSPSCNVVTYNLEKEIDILEAKENKLDELIYHMMAEFNSLKESEKEYPLKV